MTIPMFKRITDYYASLNELASLLADDFISLVDYRVQHKLLEQLYHEHG